MTAQAAEILDDLSTLKVLVVDDGQDFRMLTGMLIDRDERLTLIGLAGTALEMTAYLLRSEPDVVLLDWNMPDLSGHRLVAVARNLAPGATLLIHTASAISEIREAEFVGHGADGVLEKGDSLDLTESILSYFP